MAGGPTRIGSPRSAALLAGAQVGAWARRADPVPVFRVAPPVRDVLPAPHPAPVARGLWGPRVLRDSIFAGVIAHRVRPGKHGGDYYCWHLRTRHSLGDYVSMLPEAMAPFGIRTIDRHTIEVPDASALNGLLQAMGRPPLYYGSRWSVSTQRYVHGLADGLLPAGTEEYYFFHDLGDHVGALFFPPACLAILSEKIRILLAMAKDRRLPPASRVIAGARYGTLARRWDTLTDLAFFYDSASSTQYTGTTWRCNFMIVLGTEMPRGFADLAPEHIGPDPLSQEWRLDVHTAPDVVTRVRAHVERLNAASATPEKCAELLAQTIDQAINGPLELRRSRTWR